MTSAEEQEWLEHVERWNAYLWEPDGEVLRNKLGLRDFSELRQVECRLRVVRQGEIDRGEVNIPRTFDKAHLQAIHGHLFQDLYDWAGEFRDVDFIKNGDMFVPYDLLDEWTEMAQVTVVDSDWSTMSRMVFLHNASEVYAYLNLTHPFREGNGATGKVFLNHVAEMSPYRLDFDRLEEDELKAASAAAFPADLEESAHPNVGAMYETIEKIIVRRDSVEHADPELTRTFKLLQDTYPGIDKSGQSRVASGGRGATSATAKPTKSQVERES